MARELAVQSDWRRELRTMLALAIPVVLSELGWMAQGVVDTIMVGKLGPAAIGAVAVGNAVYYVPSLFGIGILLGLDTLVSHAYGRNDHDACHHWLAQGVYLACIATPLLMIITAAASYGFARFGITPEVAGLAGGYLRIINFGTLPLLLYGAARRYLQAVGQVRVITVTLIIANLVNWLGNWVLIYGKLGLPALGVNGSAISTCLARVGMAVALIGFAWRYERSRGHPLFRHWARPSLLKIRQLMRLGAPAAGQIVLEVGAWNRSHLCCRLAQSRRPGHAFHRPQLRQPSHTWCRSACPLPLPSALATPSAPATPGAPAAPDGWRMTLGTGFMVLAAIVFLLEPRPLIVSLHARPTRPRRRPRLALRRRRVSDLRWHSDRFHGRPPRLGPNPRPHDRQFCGILGSRPAPRPDPLLRTALGRLRALDRPDPGPRRHCIDTPPPLAQGEQ